MSEDDQFLSGILAAPEDSTRQLIYADWLEERGDPRGEYLRLMQQLNAPTTGQVAALGPWKRIAQLRLTIPSEWLAFFGDHRCDSSNPDPGSVELAASTLGRSIRVVDRDGYGREIVAGATNSLNASLAYVECRSKRLKTNLDIHYHLHLRGRGGRTVACEPQTYNPYFGCDVRFLKWYGHVTIMIYREKHHTYVCRFGFDSPADFKEIEDAWVVNGWQLGYRGYRESTVSRYSLPGLDMLPDLSTEEAANWDLLPTSRS